MLVTDNPWIEHARGRIKRIHRRINSELGDLARQNSGGVEMRERCCRRRVREIVGRHIGLETQRGYSSDLLFDMAHMLSYISRYVTLEPGDLIWSGTMGTTQAMNAGDTYEVEVVGVGVLSNEVVQGK